MSWNNSSERQRFDKAQRKQASRYKKLGMTDEQIRGMHEFDLAQFHSDRRFYSHTVLLEPDRHSDDENSDTATTTIEDSSGHSRFWWMEELDNPEISKQVKMLSERDKRILSMYVVEQMSQSEIAVSLGISQPTLCRQIKRIEDFLRDVNKKRVFAG